jgi:molybdopterin-containing oxidoreductase family iron-sulfur binding subunit
MTINRRDFLRIAGLSAIVGVGAPAVINNIGKGGLEASQISPDPRALKAKRWGFVVDVGKLTTEEDYQKCIDACHNIHNVPSHKEPKHEVKWIWKDTYEHTFPNAAEDKIMNKELQE